MLRYRSKINTGWRSVNDELLPHASGSPRIRRGEDVALVNSYKYFC